MRNDSENMEVVKCSRCGKEDVIQFYPGESEKKKRARVKNFMCFDCYKKSKSGEAAEYNRRRGYSQLKGSYKQIDYAESLRKQHIFRIVNHLEVIGQKAFAKRAEKYLGSKTSAEWWIKHAEYSAVERHIQELIQQAIRRVS